MAVSLSPPGPLLRPAEAHACGGRWRLFSPGTAALAKRCCPSPRTGTSQRQARALAAYALGLDALRRERQEEALGHWEAARRLGLDTPSLRDNLHQLYHALAEEAMAAGRWIDAAALVDAARSLASGGQELTDLTLAAHFHAGHAEAQAGRWRQALAHWEKTRDLGENSRELLQDLALAYEKDGRFGDAADLWRQVVRRRPRKADVPEALTRQQVALLWGHVAECYRRAGDVEEAITTLRNAVKNDPDNVDLRLELVDVLVADDRWGAARQRAKPHPRKRNRRTSAHSSVRRASKRRVGDRPAPKPIWRKVLALDPNHLEAQERLTELLEREGYRLDVIRPGGPGPGALPRGPDLHAR